jgi:O-antigen/teichoic acid export membrane protein
LITKKFIRNSVIYTIAGALPMASAIILLPVYVEYIKSASVYGALILYMGFSLLVQVLVTYSFDTSIYNFYHDFKHNRAQLSVFVSSVFTFILLVSLGIGAFFVVTGHWLFERVYGDDQISFYPYGLVAVVTGVFQSLFKVNSSLLQTQERAIGFLIQNLISFSLIASFTIVGLHLFPNELTGPMLGRLFAVTISGLWVLFNVYREYGFHYNFNLIKSTFGFNHPSLIYQIMQWFNNYYDKILLKLYLPLESLAQVGVYDFAFKCLQAIEFVLTGFYNSFFPKVLGITALQTEKRTTVEINRYYNGLTAVTIILVTGCIFIMPAVLQQLVDWFNRPQYLPVIKWIPYIAITYLLRSFRFYVAMPYASLKYSKPLPLFYLVIVTIKIAGMILLIPKFGIHGAIIATWVGYIVEVTILFFGVKNKFSIQFNAFKLIVAPLLLALIIGGIEPLFGGTYPLLLHAFYIFLGAALLIWAYRNELKAFEWKKIIK